MDMFIFKNMMYMCSVLDYGVLAFIIIGGYIFFLEKDGFF